MKKIQYFIAKYGDISLLDGKHYKGYLDLQDTQITSLPEGLTVGGYLDLQGTQITSLPEGLTVGRHLDLRGTQITSLPEGLTVGGSLYLQGTQITSLPEGLTVGRHLDLRGTQITSLPEGLTVGGSLDLRGTQITSLPEGLTVGGSLDLQGTQITDTSMVNRNIPKPLMWEWHGRKYIKADDIFQRLIERKGNVCHVKSIGSNKITYLVTDGNGKWAHGDTIQEAKADLIYKISNRDKSKYEGWTMQTEVSFEEAIEAYRVITGACSAGTRGFVERVLPESEKRDRYTIAEVVKLTEGQYGHETFKEFFEKK